MNLTIIYNSNPLLNSTNHYLQLLQTFYMLLIVFKKMCVISAKYNNDDKHFNIDRFNMVNVNKHIYSNKLYY